MKHTIAFLLALLAFATLHASNDATLAKIASGNQKVNSLIINFSQTKVLANKQSQSLNGVLYYTNEGKMAMNYEKPAGDRFVISGNKVMHIKSGKRKTFDMAKTASVKSLANSLLWALSGQVQKVADANNADIAVEESSDNYTVTLTARKRQVKGYAKLVLIYSKKNGLLQSLSMEEFNHVVNTYSMQSVKSNTAIADQSVFAI